VKLFFELNGQPRSLRVPVAGAKAKAERAKAEAGNARHIGAAMPGLVSMVAVKAGQKVRKGDPLLAIEAMKMETVIRAEADATIKEVCVKRGTTVNAHDLMVILA
jgi:pyruvate carboxylase